MSAVPYLVASVPLRLASAGSAAAIPVLAVESVHSIALGGGLVAASLAPSILAAPLAGALLDRSRHPTRLMVLAGAVTAAALVVTALLGVIPTAVIAVVLVAAGAVTPFFMGGMSSFVTDAVPGTPERAFGADALSYNIGSVAGPALAAGAIALGSGRAAVLVLATIAAAGTIACGLLRLHPHPAHPDRAGVLREIARGTRYLATHRPIAVVTASGALSQVGQGALPIAAIGVALATTRSAGDAAWIVTGFAIGALLGSLAVTTRPIAAIGVALATTRSAGDAAWIVTGFAIGALLGSLAVTTRPIRRIPAAIVMACSFAVTGVLALGSAIPLPLPAVIALVGLSGVATGPGVAAMLLLRTRHSPRRLRSQVFTVAAGLRATGAAVGAGLAGLLPEDRGGMLLALIGACWLVSAAILAGYPRDAAATIASAARTDADRTGPDPAALS